MGLPHVVTQVTLGYSVRLRARMVRFSKIPSNPAKSVKARGSQLRVSYKNTHEAAAALRGRTLKNAITYLNDVLEHKQAIPYRRHKKNIGRHSQAKQHKGTTQVRWPKKSCEYLLDLLKNLQANAQSKNLNLSEMYVSHVAVQRAIRQRRRTYRAHGRINPFMSEPCHINMIATQRSKAVPHPRKTKTYMNRIRKAKLGL